MERRDNNESNWRKIDAALWHPFTQMQEYPGEQPPPPIVVGAEGNFLIASDGRKYLDANCGYWCLALGCRPEKVERAVHAQLEKFSHSTLLGLSHQPAIELSGKLTRLAGPPLDHVFYADSGSEAVEVALKMAYQFHCHGGHPERSAFLALGEAYHGDTIGAVSLGGVDLFHTTFKPLLFPVRRVPPPHCYRCHWKKEPQSCALECAAAMEAAIAENAATLAAVVIEPLVLGPGGIIPQPKDYLERVVRAARKAGVLVIFDEVAVGMGRLGTLFAFQQIAPELKPDIVCLAKGLTAGLLPLSAVLASREIYSRFLGKFSERKTFFHGHTFTGSALGCAAALAALDILADEPFLTKLRDATIPAFWKALEPLRAHAHVGSLRGRGMMAGIELAASPANSEGERPADYPWAERYGHRVVLAARKRGVNIRAIGDLVLAVPPLTISDNEIQLLGRVLAESIDEVTLH